MMKVRVLGGDKRKVLTKPQLVNARECWSPAATFSMVKFSRASIFSETENTRCQIIERDTRIVLAHLHIILAEKKSPTRLLSFTEANDIKMF